MVLRAMRRPMILPILLGERGRGRGQWEVRRRAVAGAAEEWTDRSRAHTAGGLAGLTGGLVLGTEVVTRVWPEEWVWLAE